MSCRNRPMSHNRDYVSGSVSSFRRDDFNIVYLVCMVDRGSRVYPSPQVFGSLDLARRDVAYRAKYDRGSSGRPPIFVDYADDFLLVCVGRFDIVTGVIYPCNEKVAEVADILGGCHV